MDISHTIRKNISNLIRRSGAASQNAFAAFSGLPQRTINKVFIDENEIPTTKTLMKIAAKNNVETWMLLVKNFPLDSVHGKPLEEISAQGYQLLAAFEKSDTETKKAILTQMAFMLQNNENRQSESLRLMEAKADYKV